MGWRWTNGMARRVNLQVLTRESNRAAIENKLATLPDGDPIKTVTFHFHDLSKPFLWAKQRGLLPTFVYYVLWQWSVAKRFSKLAEEVEILHHITFCTLLCPGFWRSGRAAFVLGPVGAPQVNPHYLPLFGDRAWTQRLRGWIMNRFFHLPWLKRLLNSAAAIIPANTETRKLLESGNIHTKEVILDTGAPEIVQRRSRKSGVGTIRLMYAGQLEPRKGLELSLRALARTTGGDGCDCKFDIFGSGPDRVRLVALTEELGIASRVCFHGAVSQDALMHCYDTADAFLFTSVRDTSGSVNLEAMIHGLPLICIAHQGVGDITDGACAERIAPGPIEDTIRDLSTAILRLANDPDRRERMGSEARKRAREQFSWDEKFDRMHRHYREAILNHPPTR